MIWIPHNTPGAIVHPHLTILARMDEAHPWGYRESPGKRDRVCRVFRCRHRIAFGNRHLACPRCKATRWRANNPHRAAYIRLKSHAKQRKIYFDLTYEQFVEFVEDSGYLDGSGIFRGCLHIDRENALKGYTLGNIRPLEAGENSSKGAKEDKIAHWLATRRGVHYDQTQLKFDPDNTPF